MTSRKDSKSISLHSHREKMRNPYAYLGPNGDFECLDPKNGELRASEIKSLKTDFFKVSNSLKYPMKRKQVAKIAREFMLSRWRSLESRIPDYESRVYESINPASGAKAIGYEVIILPMQTGLGADYGIAGFINPEKKQIYIDSQQPSDILRFTAAHELGHAIIHPNIGLHRDRSEEFLKSGRPQVEKEADWFAVEYLMPRKLVVKEFFNRFGDVEQSKDFFRAGLSIKLKNSTVDQRSMTIALASAGGFLGKVFMPLHERFGVSVLTMAIRIEELNLV